MIFKTLAQTDDYALDKKTDYAMQRICLCYPNWRRLYRSALYNVGAIVIDGMPRGQGQTGDPTAMAADKADRYKHKMAQVEEAVRTACGIKYEDCYDAILLSITEDLPYEYFEAHGIYPPCGRVSFYRLRRKAYYVLASILNFI